MKGKLPPLRQVLLSLLALAVLVVAVLLVGRHFASVRRQGSIETATVSKRTINATVLATGTVKAVIGAEVKVGSRISGVVTRLPANIGSTVKKGDLIAQLDDREARSQVDQAQANLEAAQARLAELRAGYNAQVVQSATDIERAKSSHGAARSRLAQANTSADTVPFEVTAQIQQASASVDQAEANRKNAKVKLDRMESLYAQDVVARQDVDNAQTEFDVAEAQVRHAQAVLDAAQANSSQNELKQQDVTQAEEALRQAQSAYSLAVANAAQVRVKEQGIATARAQVAQSRAALQLAETQYSYTRIVSPINGVIALVSTQEGETIAAGLQAPTFVTIVDLSKLQVDALIDETDIGKVKVGDAALFTVDSYPDEEFEGQVTAIYPTAIIDQNVVNYDVVVTIADPRGMLRPDMTANVTINIAARSDVLAVPTKAIHREEGAKVVYVLDKGKPARRQIKTGWKDGEYTEVVSGLREGEEVVVGDLPGSARAGSGAGQPNLPPGATGS